MNKTIFFNNGYEAYFDLMARDANPYDEDTEDFEEWQSGWNRAQADSDF